MTSWAVREVYDREPVAQPAAGFTMRLVASALRVPLMVKLLGANLVIVVAAALQPYLLPGGSEETRLGVSLLVSFAVTALLVWLALRPVAMLAETAERVSSGDFAARVQVSGVADRAMTQLSQTMNRLLDRVEVDRARIQYLAGRTARARDIEREAIARELRDSLAQSVAAIALQIAVLQRSVMDAEGRRSLDAARASVGVLSDEIRTMAESLNPGTIREFGLANALNALGRVASRRTGTAVRVDADVALVPIAPDIASALYRVADEAIRNAVQHALAKHASITLTMDANGIALEVEDDGRGLDTTKTDPLQSGLGLFSARAVLALAGGELHFNSVPGHGSRVIARIPHSALVRGKWQATS